MRDSEVIVIAMPLISSPPPAHLLAGPGMLTDAVWRYMFAMYGVQPHDFTYHQRAFRVGDLLMYPHMAFRAPEEPQDDLHMIVHHHKHEWWRRR